MILWTGGVEWETHEGNKKLWMEQQQGKVMGKKEGCSKFGIICKL